MRPTEDLSAGLIFVADTLNNLNHRTSTDSSPCSGVDSLLQLHAKHRRMSTATTPTNNNSANNIAKTPLKQQCAVCDALADGWHFNALSCGACSAFFRRSVAEQKVYSCVPRSCNVSIHHRQNGIICKYCRFTRCVWAGMRTEEVQGKRLKAVNPGDKLKDKNRSKNKLKDSFMKKLIKSEPSEFSPEQASSDSRSNSNSSNSNSIPRRRLQPIVIARNRIGIGSAKCPLLNQVCAKRRLLETRRGHAYQLCSLKATDAWDLKHCAKVELDLFSCFLQTFVNDNSLLSDYYESFVNWLVFECVLSSLRLGGPQTSQVFLPNMRFFDTFDNAIFNLIHSQMPSHAVALTRLTIPVIKFFLDNVCRPIQYHHFDELEVAALETLLVAKCLTNKTEAEDLKKRTFDELFSHYVGAERDEGIRFGALVLSLSAIDELKIQAQELILCFQLINE